MNFPDIDLQQDAAELKRSDIEVIKFILEADMEKAIAALQKFVELKKKIKIQLMEISVANIQDINAREVLEKIQQNVSFQSDKILDSIQSKSDSNFDFFELDDDEINEYQDLLYVWFGPEIYVRGLYQIGSLIIGLSIPNFLKEYVDEARQCYAFQQYNAVYGLCRTIIETAIRHKCQRKGIIKYPKGKITDIDEYRPGALIDKCTSGNLRDRIKEIYADTSSLLHGRKTINSGDASFMFKNTLKAVQDLEKI